MPEFPAEFNLAHYYLFDRISEGLIEKTAVRYGERSYSYREVAGLSRAVSAALKLAKVAREQRVYIVLPDTPPFAWSFFGTLAHGSVVTMGNPLSPTEDLAYVLEYVRASALITLPEVADRLAEPIIKNAQLKTVLLVPDTKTGGDCDATVDIPKSLEDAPLEVKSLSDAMQDASGMAEALTIKTSRDDQAIWLFTSGSTGRPKAAIHTHRDFAYNTEVYAKQTVGYKRDDITVSVPRLFFGYATGTNLMFPFAVGATTCLFSERPTAEALTHAIDMYKPTIVTNVPTMMAKLLDHDDALQQAGKPALDFSSIHFHLSAGEALPPILLERFTEHFDNDVYDGIGSAEMFHIYASNRPGDVRPGSLGRAVNGYEIKILASDAEGPGAAPLPPNETGVMWVKGDSVALGYHQDRDKSWSTFHGHWCRTGDLFRVDEEGYLWFSGRADSLFKVGGVFVSPLEIEDCLLGHATVAMTVVIPAKDGGLEKPKAFVVVRENERSRCNDDATRGKLCQELQDHVKARLSKHKYPRWVVFVDDLPKNDRGKVDRKILIEQEKAGKNPWQ